MRDEFSEKTKIQLALRAGHHCSLCGAGTSGPQLDPELGMSVGVAAHITAAAPGGARYDARLTIEQRTSAANGIWTCQSCGHRIDRDKSRHTVEQLHQAKRDREDAAGRAFGRPIDRDLPTQQTPQEERYILDLERKRDTLRELVGQSLDDVHVLLSRASNESETEELRSEALRLHRHLDHAAALFVGEFAEIGGSLLELGQCVGTWWNPAYRIGNADFSRLSDLAGRIRGGLVSVEAALRPRRQLPPVIDSLSEAIAAWLERLVRMRSMAEQDYDVLQPAEVLPELESAFERALLRALPHLGDAATEVMYALRTCLIQVDRHARVRPNPHAYAPGGPRDAMVDRAWDRLGAAHKAAVATLRAMR